MKNLLNRGPSAHIWETGVPFIWLTGSALALCLLMITGLIALVLYNGIGFFWPSDIEAVILKDGRKAMGQRWNKQEIPESNRTGSGQFRIQLKVGNRDVYGSDFQWIDESDIQSTDYPKDVVVFERREWGNFYGFIEALYEGEIRVSNTWDVLQEQLDKTRERHEQIRQIEEDAIGDLNRQIESLRLKKREIELGGGNADAIGAIDRESRTYWEAYEQLADQLVQLRAANETYRIDVRLIGGEVRQIATADIVRAYRPNLLGILGKTSVYFSRVEEFLFHEPRESNTEGGVFPAIFGTVMMVFLMSLAAVPFGILAALYLREYAGQGTLVRFIRIAVNNLAGVPSIVFGMFGLGFFVYGIGGSIDQLFFSEALPSPTFGTGGILWASLTLALLTVPVMIVSAEEALSTVPSDVRAGSLALGATKLQTILRVVLPGALPGILTGIILVIARGAGEVAPLMITGVVKLAPALPVDGIWPFFHLERKFMHLGFHIYDVGFQSPNVEAARPMVYTTTLLLIGIVLALNLVAILVRNRLRKRVGGATF